MVITTRTHKKLVIRNFGKGKYETSQSENPYTSIIYFLDAKNNIRYVLSA